MFCGKKPFKIQGTLEGYELNDWKKSAKFLLTVGENYCVDILVNVRGVPTKAITIQAYLIC